MNNSLYLGDRGRGAGYPNDPKILFFSLNIIDKEYRDQEEGKKSKNRVDRVFEAAGGSVDGLVEGYKESDEGEGMDIRDEVSFLLKDEGKKEDSLIPTEFTGVHT